MLDASLVLGAGAGAASALGSLACTWLRAERCVRRGCPSGAALSLLSLAVPGAVLWLLLSWSTGAGLAGALGLLTVRRLVLWRLAR